MKRFLITTALEETWKQDEPLLFLGKWCFIYPRQLSDLKLDTEILPHHWDNRQKMFQDYCYALNLYETVLQKLAHKLNDIHHVDRSLRYWRIVVGPWLGLFLVMLLDRWISIEQATRYCDLSGSLVLTGEEDSLIPKTMQHFDCLYPSDEWNHLIYSQILKEFPDVPLLFQKKSSLGEKKTSPKKSVKDIVKKTLGPLMSQSGRLFSKNNDILLVATSLNFWEQMSLSFKLKQIPRLLLSPQVEDFDMNLSKRTWDIGLKTESGFESFVNRFLPQQIPQAYVEGYSSLISQTEQLPWPQQPQAIWASNLHSNDVLKAWVADKTEKGTPLIISQHGGNYGMGLWNLQEQHEVKISDRYLTWGWSRPEEPQIKPVAKIKFSKPIKKIPKSGKALLVTVMVQRYGNVALSMYHSSQWLEYLQEQFTFVAALPERVQQKLTVRLSQPDYGWRQVDRWQDRFPDLDINDGCSSMKKLMKDCRLYISTYNATTYLESLSMGIPTVVFWNPKYMELNKQTEPYFEELKSVGIFHNTPQAAAAHVAKVWDEPEIWWNSSSTKKVRKNFTKQFAYCPPDKMMRIKQAIQEVISTC